MSLYCVHVLAVGMSFLLIGFLVYLNMEQIKEYDFLRQELDGKLADLSCRVKKPEANKQDPMHLLGLVKHVVGETVLQLMKDVNEFFLNEGLLQFGTEQCLPECDCESKCSIKSEPRSKTSIGSVKSYAGSRYDEQSSLSDGNCNGYSNSNSDSNSNGNGNGNSDTSYESNRESCEIDSDSDGCKRQSSETDYDIRSLLENINSQQQPECVRPKKSITFSEHTIEHYPSVTTFTKFPSFECQKCRMGCSKKVQSVPGMVVMPKCCYSYTHINYADSQLGAKIVRVRGTPFDSGGFFSSLTGSDYGKNPPEHILSTNMEPGSCFAFSGIAAVTIQLAKPIYIEVIEIAHIEKCRSPTRDTSSAPKDFTVFGIENQTGREILLGDFVYGNSIPNELFTYTGDRRVFKLIKIEFVTNHGHSDYTCVYKVGLYGREPE